MGQIKSNKPLIVMMHGWSGSGAQFRRLFPGLLEAGYRVATFDAPAHGVNSGKTTHLLEFSDSLVAIQKKVGAIDTVMAHSLGAMASVIATHRGLRLRQMVLFGPHLDVNKMQESYSYLLNLNPRLSMRFRELIGQKMADILGRDDIWDFMTPEKLLEDRQFSGLLVYDTEDEEVPQEQFKAVEQHWQGCRVIETQGLGHRRILRDESLLKDVIAFMGVAE